MNNMVRQLFRFGIVGATAAVLHMSVVVLLVQTQGLAPLVANIAGFIVAFQLSYWGHRLWTFSDTHVLHRTALPRLLIVQLINFAANEALFYFFLMLHLPYLIALLLVLMILPIFTFFSSKKWVFGPSY
ncbi:MAG: GtrA family protein [Gammaproteobacteria bacterium]|nr:MAG: GtrA family protein [Gammaproteobacteria bacterium]